MKPLGRGVALAIAMIAALAPSARADEGPPWLAAALKRPAPAETPRTGAQVLEIERRVSMTEPGRLVHRERGAIRILSRDGAREASVAVPYLTDGGRVRDLKGWLVAPGGAVTRLSGSRYEYDRALGDDLYNESRMRVLDAGAVPDGSVFAYEWTLEQPEPYTQAEWSFQFESPVAVARFVLETPPGWRVMAQMVNHAWLEPTLDGTTRTWELSDLAEVEDEPYCPSRASRVPRIAVSAEPPGAAAGAASPAPAFKAWGDVAGWLGGITARAAETDATVRERAVALVSGARTEMDTLRAIARFVQDLRYASIQMGVSHGGGYQPRPPAQVLARAYGDCKDKANLMRGMLAAIGHPAHLLVLYLGDPDYVRDEWPSPSTFNHCILAIPTHGRERLPAEVEGEGGRRLLIFDPTDRYTPIGDLSTGTQGGLALVLAPGTTRLLRLPELPPEASTVSRRLDLHVDENGAATGTLVERSFGQAAVNERALLRTYDRLDYRRAVVGWLRRAMSGAELDTIHVADDSLGGRFETRATFHVPSCAQVLQNRLLILHPPLLSRMGLAIASDHPRRYPLVLPARVIAESLLVRVPESFTVDELPDTMTVEGPFARYTYRTVADGAGVRQSRVLTSRRGRLPAEEFARAREFYGRVRTTEDAPIVFARR